MDHPTAAQLARYYQTHTARNAELDAFIDTYREMLNDHPPETVTAGTADFAERELPPRHCAEILACAVERLASGAECPI